jgi:hypothetical protein
MDVGDSGSKSVSVEVAEDVVLESAEAVVASPAAAAGSAAHPDPSVALGRRFLPIRAQGRMARPISPLMT